MRPPTRLPQPRPIPDEWPLSAWTEQPQRYWYRRCDMCRQRAPFGWLYECYPPMGSDFGWWFACPTCLTNHSAWLAALGAELERQATAEEETTT